MLNEECRMSNAEGRVVKEDFDWHACFAERSSLKAFRHAQCDYIFKIFTMSS